MSQRMFEFKREDLPDSFDGGCCNSDWLYVYAESEAEALKQLFNHDAGLCASCMMDVLVESEATIGDNLRR